MPETTFDSTLAAQLGADQYGMRKYVMAFLKKGPNRDRTKEEADSLQRAHMDNITRMAEAGKLVVAGPFFDDGEVRGIYIFAVESLAEAEALTNSDPAIQGRKPGHGAARMVWQCRADAGERGAQTGAEGGDLSRSCFNCTKLQMVFQKYRPSYLQA
jgi:uncharacterized protein YciI